MSTKTSSFNLSRGMGYFSTTLKRVKGLSLFYFVLAFLTLPLQYILTIVNIQDMERLLEHPNYYFTGPGLAYAPVSAVLFTTLQMATAIIFGIYLFSYIHSKQGVDLYHALPVTRSELYFGNLLTAMTVMVFTLMVNFGIVAMVSAMTFGGETIMPILGEIVYWSMCSFALFAVCAFAAISVGTVLDSVIFSGALLSGFALVYSMVYLICESCLYGFYQYTMPFEWATRLSPVTVMIEHLISPSEGVESYITMWFALGIALVFVGIWSYQRRPSEMAQTVGNMGAVQILVRTGGVLLGGVGGGFAVYIALGMGSYADLNIPVLIICVFVASMVVYAIMELILSRNVGRIVKNLPVAAISSGGVAVFVLIMTTGGLGFESRIPETDDLVGVEVVFSADSYTNNRGALNSYKQDEQQLLYDGVFLQDAQSIETVQNLHRSFIDSYEANIEEDEDLRAYITIRYALKNGTSIYRRYSGYLPESASYDLLSLEANDQILRESGAVFALTQDKVKNSYCYENTDSDLGKDISSKDTLMLIDAIKQDLLAETPESLEENRQSVAKVEILYYYEYGDTSVVKEYSEYGMPTAESNENLDSLNVTIYSNYTNTINLLKSLGFLGEEMPEIAEGIIPMDLYVPSPFNAVKQEDGENAFIESMDDYVDTNAFYSLEDPKAFVEQYGDQLYNRVYGASDRVYIGLSLRYENGSYGRYLFPVELLPEEAKAVFRSSEEYKYYTDAIYIDAFA